MQLVCVSQEFHYGIIYMKSLLVLAEVNGKASNAFLDKADCCDSLSSANSHWKVKILRKAKTNIGLNQTRPDNNKQDNQETKTTKVTTAKTTKLMKTTTTKATNATMTTIHYIPDICPFFYTSRF